MTLEIRILNPTEAGELFRLRRSALLDSPMAFLASPEDDSASSEAAVRELLETQRESAFFGAHTPELIGVLGLHGAGFETWGVEPDAIRFEGRSVGECRMRLSLSGGI